MAKSQKSEPETVTSRLYLVTAADLPPVDLATALEARDIGCLLLQSGTLDEDTLRAAIEVLSALAQARDVAVLLEDRVEVAAATGCDGVHLSNPNGLAAARQRLGEEAIVGVGCGASRHDAITAAEGGADYVAFGTPGPGATPNSSTADPDFLDWWQSIMTLPSVAFGAATPEDCARLAAAGADFVAVTPDLDLAACQAAIIQA
jgi:thiamine-phosphate pyrophosphorylase